MVRLLPLFILFCFFAVVMISDCADRHYCPYFKNRAPSAQPNLDNCTWFRENSCCLNHELHAIFSTITTPLMAADEVCRRHINYLMCYVCAPNQETFYEDETLTVCEEFCDRWLQACGNARWKGFTVNELYKNGTEFCKARKFLVAPKDKNFGCYTVFLRENQARAVICQQEGSCWPLYDPYLTAEYCKVC